MPKTVLTRKRSWVARITVLAMVASLMAVAVPASAATAIDTSGSCPSSTPSAGFTDIGTYPADVQLAINCLANYGITQGTSATTYSPAAAVARWQMALFLTRQAEVHGVTLPDGSDQGFTDIGSLDAATQTAINQLAQLGISKGTSATTFSPMDNVSREQMALFISRLVTAAGVALPDPPTEEGFTDISGLSAESQKAINQLANVGIALGFPSGAYGPALPVQRWHMALFLTRTLAADGVIPPGQVTDVDAPQLVDVVFDASDADDTRLIYRFDQEVSITGVDDDFVLVDPTGNLYEPSDGIDKGADNEVEVIFDNDHVDAATTAAVKRAAVENTDGDENPAGSIAYQNVDFDGVSLPGDLADQDAPDIVAVDLASFDDDDDTIEIEFDVDVVVNDETGILFVEDGGNAWVGVAASGDPDDEVLTIEIEDLGDGSAPDDSDVDDFVRVFIAPGAVENDDGADNAPHSFDIAANGETDDTVSLESVDIDRTDKEVTFTFNRSVVDNDGAWDLDEFVLVAINPDGSSAIIQPGAQADLDRDSSRVIIWDTDDNGAAEASMASIIVYAGVWDDQDGDSSLVDFSTGDPLEVGHFVGYSQSFSAGTTAAPFIVSAVGDVTGLGNDYEIDVTFSQDVDNATIDDPGGNSFWLFEFGGDNLDPTVDDVDTDDEVATYTILDGDDGFDELDDGDVGVLSFDEDHAVNAWGYPSHPTSVGLD